ncbi:hypothetical protein LCGC14_1203310, partial [marine sediment metagenome]
YAYGDLAALQRALLARGLVHGSQRIATCIGISDDHRVCSATFVSISSWIGKEVVAWQKSKSVTMLF